jgi:hypothetical protein
MLAICAVSMVAAEPVARGAFDCLSPNPADWPPAARPYFMLMVSTSSSMSLAVTGGGQASCTGASGVSYGADRLAHARCALKNTVEAYAESVNFGLATYARTISGCTDDADGLCDYGTCTHANLSGSVDASCAANIGCGPEPMPAAADSSSRAGAFFRVVVTSQAVQPPLPSNVPALVEWLDGSCADSKELFASGCAPHNGMLRDAYRYYSNQWVPPAPVPGGATLVSPLTSVANGERPCRTIHAILITDGDDSCDAAADAVDAAADLFAGFVKDGINWKVKTHVIRLAGGSAANADAIAAAGGTGAAFHAEDEAQLASALAAILDPAVVVETCDNADNDCNGCTDEGFVHYCDIQPMPQNCCAWTTNAQRTTCLNNYATSVTVDDPDGDPALLPCTTAAQQTMSTTWLCVDPGDLCDGVDNNCSSGADEGCAGMPCADAAACQSGFCVDGVCCDAACGGGAVADCVACSVAAGAASDGACAAIAAGTACDDADACTQDDVCDAEACVAGATVTCEALDDCHDAGACDPATGVCSDPIKPDGEPCRGGACVEGTCVDATTSTPTSSTGVTGSDGDTADTGVTGADSDTGGSGMSGTDSGTGVTGVTDNSGVTGVTGSDGSSGASTGPDETTGGAGGCGCGVRGGDASAPQATLVTFVFAAAWRRSRRTARARRP